MMRTIGTDTRLLIEASFRPLSSKVASRSFPPIAALTDMLAPSSHKANIKLAPGDASLFATASVEMWLRSVQSLILSVAVAKSTPAWSAIIAYYSSHYCIRAFAHLLGHFQLFRLKRTVHMYMDGKQIVCSIVGKKPRDREHRYYWRVVKRDSYFAGDSLFTENNDEDPNKPSDAGHRNRASYADHLTPPDQPFRVRDTDEIRARIRRLSELQFDEVPIPDYRKYLDIDSTHLVALHRIVAYKNFVDEILGTSNRFWIRHRKPSWTESIIDFQVLENRAMERPTIS